MIIELPQVGESVTEGTITQWLKRVGDRVEKYDALVEVLTDKVSMEVPSPVAGVITELLAEEGQTLPMGAPIAAIQTSEVADAPPHPPAQIAPTHPNQDAPASPSDAPETSPSDAIGRTGVLLKDVAPVGPTGSGATESRAAPQPAQDATQAVTQAAAPEPSQDAPPADRRRRYSPAVMRLAEQHGVDLAQVGGTGMGGRITRKDVLAYIDAAEQQPQTPQSTPDIAAQPQPTPDTAAPQPAASAAAEERVPLTPIRRMIAANMTRSATEIPAAWSITEVDVSGLVRRRDAIKDEFLRREGYPITYLHFIVKAVAASLKENPLLNSSWDGDAILLKKRVNIGIAVAAPDGLVVPVIHDADALSVAGIARRAAALTQRARQGNLSLDDVHGGTFTLNNTGALGSVASQPIINHPQAAILTTEAIVKRPVVTGDAIAIRSIMNICLTFDHRIMDGAEASAFATAVKRRLETVGDEAVIY